MANTFNNPGPFDSSNNPVYGSSTINVFATTSSSGLAGIVGSRGSERSIEQHGYNCKSCGHENIHEFNKESYCQLCNEKHEC